MNPEPSPSAEALELALLDFLVTSLAETRAALASLHALEVTLLAAAEALADEQTRRIVSHDSRVRDMPRREIAAEIGTALHRNDRAVQRRLDEASVLTRDFPVAVEALGQGRIERAHVTVILETGGAMTDAAARADFERAAVTLAERETPGRLRPLLRSLAERLDPTSIDVRHVEASRRRGVWVNDLDDGMAQLIATLPAAIAHAIRDRLTRLAHAVVDARSETGGIADAADASDLEIVTGSTASGDVDDRTIEQLRADVCADILLTADPTAPGLAGEPIRASVQVVVPVLTLLGASDVAAEIVGGPPIDAGTARRLAGSACGWDRILTHPLSGAVLAVDRYRPSEEQRRHLRVRDERCRFPGCRMPVWRCDLDHTVDAALGGPTSTCNLAHLCRRHHTLKHASSWTVRQLPDGRLVWTSPTGRVHEDHPPGHVRFRPSADPPPF